MRAVLFFLCFLAVAAAGAVPAAAEGRPARDHVRAGDVRPLDEILPGIRSEHPGNFSDADGPFPDGMGGYHYRIKWLTPDGRVVWFDTDARTGRIMGTDRRGPPRNYRMPPPPQFYEQQRERARAREFRDEQMERQRDEMERRRNPDNWMRNDRGRDEEYERRGNRHDNEGGRGRGKHRHGG